MAKPKHTVSKPASAAEIRKSLGISDRDTQIVRDLLKRYKTNRERSNRAKCK